VKSRYSKLDALSPLLGRVVWGRPSQSLPARSGNPDIPASGVGLRYLLPHCPEPRAPGQRAFLLQRRLCLPRLNNAMNNDLEEIRSARRAVRRINFLGPLLCLVAMFGSALAVYWLATGR